MDKIIQVAWQLINELHDVNKELGIDRPKELNQVYKLSNELESLLLSVKENDNLLHLTKTSCKKKCFTCSSIVGVK